MNKVELKVVRSRDTITLHLKGSVIIVNKSDHKDIFDQVTSLCEKGNDGVLQIQKMFSSLKQRIEQFSKGTMGVSSEGEVYFKGSDVAVPKAIVKKLMELEKEGSDFLPLVRFWKKLQHNPSRNSREQLYNFMLKNKMNITEHGDIVFEKGVSKKLGLAPEEYVDSHSGTVLYTIGCITQMPRESVVDDPKQPCSAGLHVAPPEYVRKWYSNHILLECIVDPADVVSVPNDYDAKKVRVCKLKVVGYAPKNPRTSQIVNLKDFIQEMPKHLLGKDHVKEVSQVIPPTAKVTSTIQANINESIASQLSGKTAKEMIEYVTQKTGQVITLSIKNKAGIHKKASEILSIYESQLKQETPQQIESSSHKLSEQLNQLTFSQIIKHLVDDFNANEDDFIHISPKDKKKLIKEAVKYIETRSEVSQMIETQSKSPLQEQIKISTDDAIKQGESQSEVEVLEITLTGLSKKELIDLAKSQFNEKVGGWLSTESTIRDRVKSLFQSAGYTVK